MSILVTGGTGFLGKHIQNEFNLYKNYKIHYPSSKKLDLLNYDKLESFINYECVDTIVHMAAYCGGIWANRNAPADFTTKNIQMGLNIFEAAKNNNVKYVYTLGSVCSYPSECPVPFKESDLWNGRPHWSNEGYGHAKRTLLMLGLTYREQYGIKGAHLIPVNLYGPFDHFDLSNSHVIPALIRKIYEAKINNIPSIECWGTGKASREFFYAVDAAEAIGKAVFSKLDCKEPINLGTGSEILIKDLIYLITSIIDYKGKIIFDPSKPDGQIKRKLNVKTAEEKLGFKAKTLLAKGLKETIEYYKNNRERILNEC